MNAQDRIDDVRVHIGAALCGKGIHLIPASIIENITFGLIDLIRYFLSILFYPFVWINEYRKNKRELKDDLKAINTLIWRTIGWTIKSFLRAISGHTALGIFSGIMSVFYVYYKNTTKYSPLIMSTDTLTDVCLLPVRFVGNLAYGAVYHVGEMFTELFYGVIHLDISEFFGSFSHILDIGALRMIFVEYAFFSDSIEFAKDMVLLAPKIYIIMKIIRIGLWICDKVNRKDKNRYYKVPIISKMLQNFSRLALGYGIVSLTVGYAVYKYEETIGLTKTIASFTSLGISALDLIFNFITLPFSIVLTAFDYLTGRGVPTVIALFAGKTVGSACHVLQNLGNYKTFVQVGTGCLVGWIILSSLSCCVLYSKNKIED